MRAEEGAPRGEPALIGRCRKPYVGFQRKSRHALNDLAALGRAAAARGKRVPTLTLETNVRFATPADQRRFADELTTAFATLAAKYHQPDTPQGRTFRVFACGYPAVPLSSAEPEGGREADMEAM